MLLPRVRRVGPVDQAEQAETILEQRPQEKKEPARRPARRSQSIVNNLIMAALAGRTYENPAMLEDALSFLEETGWDEEKRGELEDHLKGLAKETSPDAKDNIMVDLFQKLNKL